MDAFCELCGYRWDAADPDVRYLTGTGTWECADTSACADRAAIQRGLDAAWAELERTSTND